MPVHHRRRGPVTRVKRPAASRRVRAVIVVVCGCGIVAALVVSARWVMIVASQERIVSRSGVILQRTTNDCGIAALENVYASRGLWAASAGLREHLVPQGRGLSMRVLRDQARADGLPAIGVRTTLSVLRRMPLPTIVAVDRAHYLVVRGFGPDGGVLAIDPAKGLVEISPARFAARWKQMALCFGSAHECTGGSDDGG